MKMSDNKKELDKESEYKQEIFKLKRLVEHYEAVLLEAGMNSYLDESHPSYFNTHDPNKK